MLKYTNSLSQIFKKLAAIVTLNLSPNDEEFLKYKDQILQIVKDRYVKELGYNIGDFDIRNVPINEFIITINDLTDKVLAVAGIDTQYGQSRARMFAIPQNADLREQQAAIFDQIGNIFKNPGTFAEITVDLLNKLERLNKLYKKLKGKELLNVYYFPAETAAILIPGRKILVNDNGVFYAKRIVGANTFADKVVISGSPQVKGYKGYLSLKDASNTAKYKGKLIQGHHSGKIKEFEFNPTLWGQ